VDVQIKSAIGSAATRLQATFQKIWTGHRKVAIAVSAIIVVAIVATSALVVANSGGKAQATPTAGATIAALPSASPSPMASPTDWVLPSSDPTSVPAGWAYSDLDGRPAPIALAHRLPVAVMIADNIVSRPQSGISTASIVYQAYADGGEDRYMMIWQEGTATDIGPARSARPYYLYWASEYKALYAHVGGDRHSLLQVIPAMAKYIYNLDALNGGTCGRIGPYRRITTRPAPQNDCAAQKGYPATYQNLPTRPFKDDEPLAQRPAAQLITVPYRTYKTGIGYQYDRTTDSYLRLVDGQPEIDPANGNQVFARTIVVMRQAVGYDPGTMDEANRPWVSNVGSGKATIYMEGKAIDATWKKATTTALTRFYDSSGAEIKFVRGEIFMQSVPAAAKVTVS
jgi:hypothetical protein